MRHFVPTVCESIYESMIGYARQVPGKQHIRTNHTDLYAKSGMYSSPAWTPTKFDETGLQEVISKFFGTLKNVYNFFVLYSNLDDIDPAEFEVDYDKRPELDRWILSKYNKVVEEATEAMDEYYQMKAVRAIQNFVAEDLSNWYIRRARRRFWAPEMTDDKKSVYKTTYDVLVGVCELIAPIAPFISDEMYTNLTGKESVHLAYYPVADKSMIDEHDPSWSLCGIFQGCCYGFRRGRT